MIRVMIALASPKLVHLPYTRENGCYVSTVPDDGSKFRLIELCEELGVETDHRALHCTLMYSKERAPEVDANRFSTASALCNEVSVFDGHDDRQYLVVNLVSDDLHRAHSRLLQAGCEHSFTPYRPHITLVSGVEVTDDLRSRINDVNRRLALDPMYVRFRSATVSDIDGS